MYGGGFGIIGSQSEVGLTLRGCIGANSLVGNTLGGLVVAGTANLGAGTAILAVEVVRFKNSRDRVTSASACYVQTVA